MRADSPFFPAIAPARSGHLQVGDGHALYWETCGAGAPLLILHGGPGGAIRPYYRQLADPARYQAILFEQRGCGRSTPEGALHANTTRHLIADIEALRAHLGIERWCVLGGSWGSTLALAYAQAHPGRVAGLVVSGVFLARAQDMDWLWEGARAVFPDVFAARDAILSDAERADPRAALLARILGEDAARAAQAGAAVLAAEAALLDLFTAPNEPMDAHALLGSARVYAHYDSNGYFLAPGQLLRDASRLDAVPGAIIAGRADMCTPPKGAFDLSRAWPRASFQIVSAAGHRWSDPLLAREISGALARLADQIGSSQ